MVLAMKNWYFGGSPKSPIFRGSLQKVNMEGGLPKKGAWTVCRFKEGLVRKRGGMVLSGGWHPNAHHEKESCLCENLNVNFLYQLLSKWLNHQ